MNRRHFLKSSLQAGAAAAFVGRSAFAQARKFKLGYAPHFGMFAAHAGADLVAQLEFMASEGFTALEDNGMRGRSVEDQDRIGRALARLNMRMGVFVAHTINWTAPTLTSLRAVRTAWRPAARRPRPNIATRSCERSRSRSTSPSASARRG